MRATEHDPRPAAEIQPPGEHDQFMETDGMCECGQQTWEMCDCGKFFLEWICGYNPSTGQCSMAGTEDCDWECPRGL